MNRAKSIDDADCLHMDAGGDNPDFQCAVLEPFSLDGVIYCQADECGLHVAHSEKGDVSVITVALNDSRMGLAVPMSATGAREWGQRMIKIADELEANAASQAADALKRATQGGAA